MTQGNTVKSLWSAQWLLSPWTIFLAIFLGIFIGISSKDISTLIAPYGKIYLSLLKMCILPILISAVASSLGKLLKAKTMRTYLKRIAVFFVFGLIVASILGLAVGFVGQPGVGINRGALGELIHKSAYTPDLEISLFGGDETSEEKPGLTEFLVGLVPSNIFHSMAYGKNLQVLIFSIILGIAAGSIRPKPAESLFALLDELFVIFTKVIKWAMYVFPIGICCLIADQISHIGIEVLSAMVKFIVVFYVISALVLVMNTTILWYRSRLSLSNVLSALKEPVFIAFGTRNSLAALPSALDALHERLKFDKIGTDLLLPLGITICRYGNILYFALSTIFVSQLYGVSLGINGTVIAIIGSIMAGIATTGASGIATLAMMLIVLSPLGLPFEAVIVLFIGVDPIVSPMRALLNVHANCAITSAIADKKPSITQI